ncbi:MAG TPA: MFS transporter [Caulobacteraceae bacterium]|nr:MFS transporter [Caulobacteraceae bacterium]
MSQAEAPRLGLATKVSYGLGSVAQAVAGVALSTAIINFYLIRVVGLQPAVVGVVILVSLGIDAVLDPAIGRVSDGFRSRWGRRHPFMYASALPIAAAIYFLWRPPHGLSHEALAAYVLALLVTLRLCVSLYQIPSDALTPELAPDYHERTSLISYRWFFGVFGSVVVTLVLLEVFLRKDASHPLGMMNRQGYGAFGLLAAIVVFVAILVSSAATHRYIPRLAAPPVRRQSFAQAAREILRTVGNPSLVSVMSSGLFSGVAAGLAAALSNFMNLYFWGLSPQVIGAMVFFASPAAVLGIVVAPRLSRALDKKRTMLAVFTASIFTGVIPVSLRLLGLMPPNGSPWIPVILIADTFVATTLALIGFVIISSMIADIVEDSAVKTGVRSEGLLFAANGLLPKFTNGIGSLAGNLLLQAVGFPSGARGAAEAVAPAVMRHLAILSLPAGAVLNLIAVSVLVFYRIDRRTHLGNLEALALEANLAAPTAIPGAGPPIADPVALAGAVPLPAPPGPNPP